MSARFSPGCLLDCPQTSGGWEAWIWDLEMGWERNWTRGRAGCCLRQAFKAHNIAPSVLRRDSQEILTLIIFFYTRLSDFHLLMLLLAVGVATIAFAAVASKVCLHTLLPQHSSAGRTRFAWNPCWAFFHICCPCHRCIPQRPLAHTLQSTVFRLSNSSSKAAIRLRTSAIYITR